MANKTDISTGIAVILCSALGAYGIFTTSRTSSATDSLGPEAFPAGIISLLFLCGVLLTVRGLKGSDTKKYWPPWPVVAKTLANIVLFLIYAALVMILGNFFMQCGVEMLEKNMGFAIGTFIYLIGAFYLNGQRCWWKMLLMAILVPASIIVLFDQMFQISLP